MLSEAIATIETEIGQRRSLIATAEAELASLTRAADDLRAIAGPHSKSRHSKALAPAPAPAKVDPPAPVVPPSVVPPEMKGAYPEVRARRQRVLDALPLGDPMRCQDIARALDLSQGQVQSDLEVLASRQLAERVSWGRWRRATYEEVVFSGRGTLVDPESPAFARPRGSEL